MVLEAGAEVESLHKTIYQGEGTELSLLDKIPEKENRQEKLLDKVLLEELLGRLEAEERKLIYMRYFQDMTQTEIARQLHISQVQVSRMEKRILKKLKKLLENQFNKITKNFKLEIYLKRDIIIIIKYERMKSYEKEKKIFIKFYALCYGYFCLWYYCLCKGTVSRTESQ